MRYSLVILILENSNFWSFILRWANHFLSEQYSKSIFILLSKSSFWFLVERSNGVGVSGGHRKLVLVQIFRCYRLFVLVVWLAVCVNHLQVILVVLKFCLVALYFLNYLNFDLFFFTFYLKLNVISRILCQILIFRLITYLIMLKLKCCCCVLVSI